MKVCEQCGTPLTPNQLKPRGSRVPRFCKIACATAHYYRHVERNYDEKFLDNTQLKAYLTGFFESDGHLSPGKAHKSPTVKFHITDKQLVDDIVKATGYTGSVHERDPRVETIKNTYRKTFVGKKVQYGWAYTGPFAQYLMGLGFKPGQKTGREFLPREMLDEKMFAHYIRGLWDGDGTIGLRTFKTGKTYLHAQLVCASPVLLCCVHYNLYKLGIARKGHFHKGDSTFVISYSHNDTVRLCRFMYENATIKLDRKYANYLAYKDIVVAHDVYSDVIRCSYPECCQEAHLKGMCKTHYDMRYRQEHPIVLTEEQLNARRARAKEYGKIRRAEHRDEINAKKREQNKKYYYADIEKSRSKSRYHAGVYAKNNRDAINARKRARRAAAKSLSA